MEEIFCLSGAQGRASKILEAYAGPQPENVVSSRTIQQIGPKYRSRANSQWMLPETKTKTKTKTKTCPSWILKNETRGIIVENLIAFIFTVCTI